MVSSYQILKELENNGTLREMTKRGLISTSIVFYLQVYSFYLKSTTKHLKRMDAVYETAEQFNIGLTSVYKIILKMTK